MVMLFPTVQADGDGKTEMQVSPASKEAAAAGKMMSVAPTSVAGKLVGPAVSSGMATTLELTNPTSVRANSVSAPQPCAVLPAEAWLQVWSAYISSLVVQIIYSDYIRDACKNTIITMQYPHLLLILK